MTQRKSDRIKQPTKRARGLNYDEEMNLAIYLTEFNTYNNEIQKDPTTFQEAIR